jgi:hypothetical protein
MSPTLYDTPLSYPLEILKSTKRLNNKNSAARSRPSPDPKIPPRVLCRLKQRNINDRNAVHSSYREPRRSGAIFIVNGRLTLRQNISTDGRALLLLIVVPTATASPPITSRPLLLTKRINSGCLASVFSPFKPECLASVALLEFDDSPAAAIRRHSRLLLSRPASAHFTFSMLIFGRPPMFRPTSDSPCRSSEVR